MSPALIRAVWLLVLCFAAFDSRVHFTAMNVFLRGT